MSYSIIGARQAATLQAMSGRWERAADIAARLPASIRGSVHMTLKRLLARGLVVSEVREHGVRVWQIKSLGSEELRVWRAAIAARADTVVEQTPKQYARELEGDWVLADEAEYDRKREPPVVHGGASKPGKSEQIRRARAALGEKVSWEVKETRPMTPEEVSELERDVIAGRREVSVLPEPRVQYDEEDGDGE